MVKFGQHIKTQQNLTIRKTYPYMPVCLSLLCNWAIASRLFDVKSQIENISHRGVLR